MWVRRQSAGQGAAVTHVVDSKIEYAAGQTASLRKYMGTTHRSGL